MKKSGAGSRASVLKDTDISKGSSSPAIRSFLSGGDGSCEGGINGSAPPGLSHPRLEQKDTFVQIDAGDHALTLDEISEELPRHSINVLAAILGSQNDRDGESDADKVGGTCESLPSHECLVTGQHLFETHSALVVCLNDVLTKCLFVRVCLHLHLCVCESRNRRGRGPLWEVLT